MKELSVAVRHIASGATSIDRKHIPDDQVIDSSAVDAMRAAITEHPEGAEYMALIAIPGGKS